jgi:TonB family protein
MSARSLGIAVLLHALMIGVALQQWAEPRHVQPEAVLAVATEVQAASSLPEPQSPPAVASAWPAPEVELPGDLPPPDREMIHEPEPGPVEEPQPEFMETIAPPPVRAPLVESGLMPPADTPAAAESVPVAAAPAPRATRIEGFPAPDVPPRILDPEWPRVVRERFRGTIEVKVVVGVDGTALRVEVVDGTGNPDWDGKLESAFRRARYIPGMHRHAVLICSHNFRVHFRRP